MRRRGSMMSGNEKYANLLEYIANTGGQNIILPFIIDENTDAVEMTFSFVSVDKQCRLWSTKGSATAQTYINGSGQFAYTTAAGNPGTYIWQGSRYVADAGCIYTYRIDYANGTVRVLSVPYARYPGPKIKGSDKFGILVSHSDAHPSANVRLYNFRVWRNNKLVFDLVPAEDKKGVACLWCNKKKRLFYNSGIGAFAKGGIIIPSEIKSKADVTELEYIENTDLTINAPFIDTEIIATTGIRMEMMVKWNVVSSSNTQYMGNTQNPFFGQNGTYVRSDKDGETPSMTDFEKLVSSTDYSSVKGGPLTIFRACNEQRYIGSRSYSCSCKLKYFKVFKDDVLIGDFIPAKNKGNVVGMWDNITNKFFTNRSASGAFIGGPDIEG